MADLLTAHMNERIVVGGVFGVVISNVEVVGVLDVHGSNVLLVK